MAGLTSNPFFNLRDAIKNNAEVKKFDVDINCDLGEKYGEAAVDFYAQKLNDPNASDLEKGGAFVGGTLASLWTRQTSNQTFNVLTTAWSGAKGVQKLGQAADDLAPKLWQRLGKDIAEEVAEETFAPGTIGAAKAWSKRARINAAELPRDGKIRYVPPDSWYPSSPLPKTIVNGKKGFADKFGNAWVKGPSRTEGDAFEWDVQLPKNVSPTIKALSPDGKHLNVSLGVKITH